MGALPANSHASHARTTIDLDFSLAVIVRREAVTRHVGVLPFGGRRERTGEFRTLARLADGDGTEVEIGPILDLTLALRDRHDHRIDDLRVLRSISFPDGADEMGIDGPSEFELAAPPGRYVLLLLIDSKPVHRTRLRVPR